jgi:hypothetical protein
MEFSPQEHRPELEINKLYQGTSSNASESVPTTSNNETNYSNVPPGIANAYSFSELTGSSGKNAQEQPKGLSSSGGMLAGMAAAPMMLAQNAGTLPAPSGAGAIRGLGKAGSLLRGAGKILGPVGGIILEGVFAEPAGGAKELEWERRNAERQRLNQPLQSTHDHGGGKNSQHGKSEDRPSDLRRLQELEKQLENAQGKEKKEIKKKMDRLRQDMAQRRKGENHSQKHKK